MDYVAVADCKDPRPGPMLLCAQLTTEGATPKWLLMN